MILYGSLFIAIPIHYLPLRLIIINMATAIKADARARAHLIFSIARCGAREDERRTTAKSGKTNVARFRARALSLLRPRLSSLMSHDQCHR